MVFRRAIFFIIALFSINASLVFATDPQSESVSASFLDADSKPSVVGLYRKETELQDRLAKDPGNADYYFELSNVYAALFDQSRKKDTRQAVDWLNKSKDALVKVVMIQPDNKAAHYNLGVVYKRQDLMEKAREELKKAIGLCKSPEDSEVAVASWVQIGMIYEEQGFFDEAKEAYLKARELSPEDPNLQAILDQFGERKTEYMQKHASSALNVAQAPLGTNLGPGINSPNALPSDQSNSAPGLGQAIPYLGQMLMQKFGNGKDDQDS